MLQGKLLGAQSIELMTIDDICNEGGHYFGNDKVCLKFIEDKIFLFYI